MSFTLLLSESVQGGADYWTNNGTLSLSNATSLWVTAPTGGTLTNPVSGDNWYFTNTAATTLTFNYPTGWEVSGISINSGANAFSIGGGTITLTGNLTNNSSYATVNGNTISSALIVNTNILITNIANGYIAFGGNVSGTGTISAASTTTGGRFIVYGGNWSGFSGTLILGTAPAQNGRVQLVTNVSSTSADYVMNNSNSGIYLGPGTFNLGSLSGSNGVIASAVAASTITMAVGYNNKSTVFWGNYSTNNNLGGFTHLTKMGAGTLSLTGTNTYNGSTTVSNGVLALGTNGTTGSISNSTNIMLGGGSLAFNRSDTVTQGVNFLTNGNALAGTGGGLIQAGSGTTILTKLNTYTGDTIITAGTLRINGTNTNSAVSVTGGTLAGVGTLGNITVTNGGTITSGGANGTGIGTLTAASLVMNGGSTYFVNFSGPQTNDLISVTGTGGVIFTNTNTQIIIALTNTFSNPVMILSSSSSFSNYSSANFSFTINGASGKGFSAFSSNSNTQLYIKYTSLPNLTLTSPPGTTILQSASTYSAGISGNSNVVLTGGGEYVLNVSNSYADTTIAAGTLTATSSNSFSSGEIFLGSITTNVGSNVTVNINSAGVTLPNNITVDGRSNNVILNSYNGTVAYSGVINLTTNNATMSNSAGGNLIASGNIKGSGVLSINAGSGTVTLSGVSSNYTGGTLFNSGTLSIRNDTALGTGTLTVTGNRVLQNTNFTLSNAIVLTTGATLTMDVGTGFGISAGMISGPGSLIKTGSGTMRLQASNSYTGATAVNGGIMVLGNNNALPSTTTLTIGDANTLNLNGFNATVVSLSSGGSTAQIINSTTNSVTLTVSNASGGSIFDGTISGPIGLSKSGGGALTLTASNIYSSGTILSGGTLGIGNNNALGTGTLTVTNNPTLQATTNPLSITNGIVLTGSNNTLTMDSGANLWTNNGSISGNGSILKTGSGTLSLFGFNTYVGNTILTNGTLIIDKTNSLGAASGTLTFAGTSTLSITNTGYGDISDINRSIILNAASTINNSGSSNIVSGVISGSGSLIKTGSGGNLTLVTSNTYTGSTTVAGGTLQIGTNSTSGSIASSTNIILISGGTLAFSRSDTLTQGSSNFPVANVPLSGNGVFTQMGSGTTILIYTNNYTGTTTVSGGVLQIGSTNGNTGSISNSANINLTGSGYLAFNFTNTVTQGVNFLTNGTNITGGSGGLMQIGSGTLILNKTNTYTGDTIVSKGTLILSNSLAIQNSVLNLSGGNLRFGTNLQLATFAGLRGGGGLALNNQTNGAVTLTLTNASNASSSTIYSGGLSGGGALILAGAGTQTLSGSNSYSNGTTLNAGALIIGNSKALGTGTLTVNSNSTLLDTNFTLTNSIVLNGGSTILTMDSGAGLWKNAGSISGDGAIQKIGNGTLALTPSNSYTGGTILNAGTIVMGDSNALGAGGLIVNSNSTLQNASFSLNKVIVLNSGSATLTMDSGEGSWTNNGVISGNGALFKTGSGFLVLTVANSYSGGTTLSGGTLVIGDPSALGSTTGALNVSSGTLVNDGFNLGVGTVTLGSATISGSGTITGTYFKATNEGSLLISNSLAGAGGFTNGGSGITTLVATNTYAGATFVTNGTLVAGNSNAISTNAITVSNGVLNLADNNIFTNQFYLGSGTIQGGLISNKTSFTGFTNGTVSSSLVGQVSLSKNGSGALTLSGVNQYSEGTFVNNGTLTNGGPYALGSGSVTVAGGALDLGGYSCSNSFFLSYGLITNGTISNNVMLSSGQLTNGIMAASLIGTGTLVHNSPGTLILSGFNKYSGGNVFTGGGYVVAMTTNALGNSAKPSNPALSLNNAGLWVAQTNTLLKLGYGTITLQSNSWVMLAYGSGITNSGRIMITNSTSSNTNVIYLDNTWIFSNNVAGPYNLISAKSPPIYGANSNSIALVLYAPNKFTIQLGTTQTNTNSAYRQTYTFTNTSTSFQFICNDVWSVIQTIPKEVWSSPRFATDTARSTATNATNGGIFEISTSPFGTPSASEGYTLSAVINGKGQVVVFGNLNYSQVLSNIPTGATRISAGYDHIMALQSGRVYVWPTTSPLATNQISGIVEISAGYMSCLAIKSDGGVVGWGRKYNEPGSIFNPTFARVDALYNAAAVLRQTKGVIGIADGCTNGLALLKSGTVVGFGQPFDLTKYPYPSDAGVEVSALGLTNVAAISISQNFALALKKDGTVVAWGVPNNPCTQVPDGLSGVVSISAGYDYALALKTNGTVVAWGATNNPGANIPLGLLPVAAIEAGYQAYSLVARTNNGRTPLDDCHTAGGMSGSGGGGGGQWIKPIPWSTPASWTRPPQSGSSSSSSSTVPIRPPQKILPQSWH